MFAGMGDLDLAEELRAAIGDLGRRDAGRRQVMLTLTASGDDALAAARRARAAGMARAIREDLDDAEREIVRRIPEVLRKLQP